MKPKPCLVFAIIPCVMLSSANAAVPTTWRTPPIKLTSNQATISCDLLNNSGQSVSTNALKIQVRAIAGNDSSIVVSIPGALVLEDGKGIRGSTPLGLFSFNTVYCELVNLNSMNALPSSMLFTMTVTDAKQKAVTVAIPPR